MKEADPNPAYGAHLRAFAGIPTFMRQPASRMLEGIDTAIVGIPYDGGANSHRAGARFGPRKIREMSGLLWGYNKALGVAPLENLRLVDYGDVDISTVSITDTMQAITNEVGEIVEAGSTVVALGGDHSISLPLLQAHAAKYGPLACIHIDSHCDTSPGHYSHGTPFRFALEQGYIDAEAYIQVGIRGPDDRPGDLEAARALGARIVTIEEAFEMGIPGVVELMRSVVGARRTYVSLDIDAADPAFAPGTGTPEVGGFNSFQMLQLVRGLKGLRLVGFDLVEVSPPYDHGDITAILAANLAFEFISLQALGPSD